MSTLQMSSGLRKPLDTIVGVQRNSRSLRRTVMLPSLAAAKPLAYTRRPISQICSFSLYSLIMVRSFRTAKLGAMHARSLMVAVRIGHRYGIQYASAVRIHRLLLGKKRHRRLAAFAEGDPA